MRSSYGAILCLEILTQSHYRYTGMMKRKRCINALYASNTRYLSHRRLSSERCGEKDIVVKEVVLNKLTVSMVRSRLLSFHLKVTLFIPLVLCSTGIYRHNCYRRCSQGMAVSLAQRRFRSGRCATMVRAAASSLIHATLSSLAAGIRVVWHLSSWASISALALISNSMHSVWHDSCRDH